MSVGKMLGDPLDRRTFISRTKADWKMIRREVEYHELGNQWLLLRFANSADRNLVWDELPWHVQGGLLVSEGYLVNFENLGCFH